MWARWSGRCRRAPRASGPRHGPCRAGPGVRPHRPCRAAPGVRPHRVRRAVHPGGRGRPSPVGGGGAAPSGWRAGARAGAACVRDARAGGGATAGCGTTHRAGRPHHGRAGPPGTAGVIDRDSLTQAWGDGILQRPVGPGQGALQRRSLRGRRRGRGAVRPAQRGAPRPLRRAGTPGGGRAAGALR